jgi:hypothetical protein
MLDTYKTAHARNTDPETSHTAASIVNVGYQRRVVLASLLELGCPSTDEEIYNTARYGILSHDMTPQGLRSRRCELMREGYIETVDRYGITANGRSCRRYRLTKEGKELAEHLDE